MKNDLNEQFTNLNNFISMLNLVYIIMNLQKEDKNGKIIEPQKRFIKEQISKNIFK